MANYNLVVNSKFQPFSFERYLQPYQIYGQAYKEVEDALGELDTKASVWENMANEQTDPKAYGMYKAYADELREQASQLAKEGLNTASRKNMLNMRARYNKEIAPIEQAYTARAEEVKEQLAGKAAGMVYEGDATTASLDRYLGNPTVRYRGANSQESYKRVLNTATALSKRLRDYGRGKSLDPFVNTWLQEHGYRDTEIGKAISDVESILRGERTSGGNNILTSILNDEMTAAGVNDWNEASKLEFYSKVAPALYGAVGQTNVGTFKNTAAELAAQEAMAIRAENRAKERAKEAAGLEGNNISLRDESFLITSGKEAEYLKNIRGLRAGQQGVKASIFGRNGKANALKIYEEYNKVGRNNLSSESIARAEEEGYAKALAWRDKNYPNWDNMPLSQKGVAAQTYDRIIKQEISKAVNKEIAAVKQNILRKYGVSEVLSKEQYNTLKEIGYTGQEQVLSINQLNAGINNLAKLRTMYSTSLSEYSIPSDIITNTMSNWDTNNSFSGKAYRLNKDGSKGKPIESFKDLNLKTDDNKDGREITDIFYSDLTPSSIIIQVGKGTGERYVVDSNVLGGRAYNFIIHTVNRLKDAPSTERAQTITIGLTNLLNEYNQTRTKSSSKI